MSSEKKKSKITKLEVVRKFFVLSQEDIEKECKVSQAVISSYENNNRTLSIATIRKLIKYFKSRFEYKFKTDDFVTDIYVDRDFFNSLKMYAPFKRRKVKK